MTLAIILGYLAAVLAVGLFSRRLARATGEDFFLATRTIGPFVLLMSLFGTHMTAFSLLGAAGEGYRVGIGVFGLMASSSAIVVPVVFWVVGVRLWAVGKRRGYLTQVQYFRERWDSGGLGLLLFVVVTLLLIPYLLIGVMGGGLTLSEMTRGQVPEWAGSLLICAVVLVYVVFGGLRGTAWVNTLQTLVFMTLGVVASYWLIGRMGGLDAALTRAAQEAPGLLVRGDAIRPATFATYACIPLSVGMFPHIFMHWLTARRAESFRLPIVAYPLCVAAVWLPSVLIGVVGRGDLPGLAGPEANSILIRLIESHAPAVLGGLLAAGVLAAIMSSLDSQVLSLGTLFTQDIVRHYGFHDRMGERLQVLVGRGFVAGVLLLTFLISRVSSPRIFGLGVWSFSGFAALFPIVLAALFWRRSTKHGVVAAVLVVAAAWTWYFARSHGSASNTVGSTGIMPVAVLIALCAITLVLVSLVTRPPREEVLARFFDDAGDPG